MKSQLQITFRNMKSSKEVEEWIREAAAKLDSFYSQIMGCRVELQIPHRHHTKGDAYHIRVDLTVPQGEIVVKREPSLRGQARQLMEPELKKHTEVNALHKNLRRTIDDAFKAAGRRCRIMPGGNDTTPKGEHRFPRHMSAKFCRKKATDS